MVTDLDQLGSGSSGPDTSTTGWVSDRELNGRELRPFRIAGTQKEQSSWAILSAGRLTEVARIIGGRMEDPGFRGREVFLGDDFWSTWVQPIPVLDVGYGPGTFTRYLPHRERKGGAA